MASKKEREKAREKARGSAKKQAKEAKRGGSSFVSLPNGVDLYTANPDASDPFSIVPFAAKGTSKLTPSDIGKGDRYFRIKFKTHRDVGPEEKMLVCPTSFGKPCPQCEEFNRLRKTDAEWDDIKALRASDRELYLVVSKGKLCLMEMPWFWFGKFLDIEIEDDDREELFFFPEDNIDVRASWEKDSFGVKAVSVRFKKRKEELDDAVIEQALAIDLAGCVIETSYKDFENMMHGVSDDDDEGDEPSEEPEPEEETPEEVAEEVEEPDETPEAEEPPPECFGDKSEYDKEDEDCKVCSLSKGCQKAIKDKEPEKAKSGKAGKSGKAAGKAGKSGKGKSDDAPDAGAEECGHDHTFGKDFDEFDECDNCKSYGACEKASKG